MPIIMSPDPSGMALIERDVTFTSGALARIERAVTFDPRLINRLERQATFSSSRLAAAVRQAVWTSSTPLSRIERDVSWSGSRLVQIGRTVSFATPPTWPVTVRAGLPARRVSLTSDVGQVISAQYSHTGTRETMNLTVAGKVLPLTQISLNVRDSEGHNLQIALDGDLRQYEVRTTPTGSVTTLHAYNRAASRLGSVRLPELIPWKLSPTPPPDRRVPCAGRPEPQEITVSSVLDLAFRAADMSLGFYPRSDPLTGVKWKEGEREYSTLGKTPDQVFADTLGQIGWSYAVRGEIANAVPTGGGFLNDDAEPDDLAAELSVRADAANTPNLVTLSGADLIVDKPNIITLLAEAPDAASLQRELLLNIDWYVTTPTNGGETIKGFRKVLGRITGTAELTLSSVTVKETVDNVLKTRTFDRVVTGFTSTSSEYDPDCPDAMLRQRTVKQSYGYTLNTDTHSTIFSGPGFIGGYEAGDALGDEEQTIFQRYSPEGYLSSRTTITRKLSAIQQLGADGPLADRGPLVAREYLTQILSESFQPVGGGRWLRLWNASGGQQLPLYDEQSGDAVGLATRGGTFNSGQETMDAAPPQVRCPDPCANQKVAYPQVLRRSIPDGREGQEVSRSLPMVDDPQRLEGYIKMITAGLGPSISTDATLSAVRDWRPGVLLSGSVPGVVQTYALDAAAGMATVKVNVRQQLETVGLSVPGLSEGGIFRDQVLWRLPGGIVVNHLKEIKGGAPVFDRIFVRATGANLPNPGDEVEWRNDTRFGPTTTGNYGN